jgi:multidrug efflux system membrane fusion protein
MCCLQEQSPEVPPKGTEVSARLLRKRMTLDLVREKMGRAEHAFHRRRFGWIGRLVAGAAALAALAAAIAYSPLALESNARGDAAKRGQSAHSGVPVLAARVESENVPITLRGIGTVQAFDQVTVKARVDGNIIQVAFREGQTVKKGDLLVQIDPRPYQIQLEQATASKAKDEAALANARLDLARYEQLLRQGGHLAVTQQQYDTQRALVGQDEAAVKMDQAQIDSANLNLTFARVTSPIDGVVGIRLVDEGNLVLASAATPLVVVTQIEPIYVTFTLAERELARVREAMAKQPLTVLAYDGEDRKQLSQGKLNVINNMVDQNSGTVTLKAEFANEDEALWPGQFVNAHLILSTVTSGLTVSAGALLMGPSGPFLYRIKPDSTIEQIPVTVVQVENERALISGKGLAAGDKVVASGQINLSSGAKVTVKAGPPVAVNSRTPELGLEGVGSTGVTTPPPGMNGITAR